MEEARCHATRQAAEEEEEEAESLRRRDLFDLWFRHQHGKKPERKLTIGKRRVTLPAPKKRPGLSTLLGLNGDNGEAL